MNPFSINNRLIVEPYKKEGLKSTVSSGFAMVQQKVALKGLKVLINATLQQNGIPLFVPAGSVAYIREEILHSAPWAQKPLECDTIEGHFMIVDSQAVEFIAPPPEGSAA